MCSAGDPFRRSASGSAGVGGGVETVLEPPGGLEVAGGATGRSGPQKVRAPRACAEQGGASSFPGRATAPGDAPAEKASALW